MAIFALFLIISSPAAFAATSTVSHHGWNTCNKGWYKVGGTYENYCPNCHKHGTLVVGSKRSDEITCTQSRGGCDSDFCFCGKEKINHGAAYLIKAHKTIKKTTTPKKVVAKKPSLKEQKIQALMEFVTTRLNGGTGITGIGTTTINGLNN